MLGDRFEGVLARTCDSDAATEGDDDAPRTGTAGHGVMATTTAAPAVHAGTVVTTVTRNATQRAFGDDIEEDDRDDAGVGGDD